MPAPAFLQTAATQTAMRAAAMSAPAATAQGGALDTAFHDLLDIVNPLQHLPVVGTLYRAISGDKIGKVEKIAGDALYGGLWGAVGSVADTAFEAITGKDFGSTVLAFAKDAYLPRGKLDDRHHEAAPFANVEDNAPAIRRPVWFGVVGVACPDLCRRTAVGRDAVEHRAAAGIA
jgi:hypothetical protein